MRPTRFGVQGGVFYLVMVVAFYSAPYSNLFFLLLSFLTLLGLEGLRSAWRNLRDVTAEVGELDPVPTGGSVRLPLELRAPAPVRMQVAAALRLVDGTELRGRVDLLDERAGLNLTGTPRSRGVYPLAGGRIESTHPFGLARMLRRFEASGELVVYPAPRVLLEGRSAAEVLDEILGQGQPGGADLQPTNLRDHRPGDGLRRIHWRATARRSRLVVTEWEGGSGQGLEVVLDRRCAPDELETALETISAMVHLGRSNKETLRIHSQDLAATFGPGQRPWADALRFLATATTIPAGDVSPPPASSSVARLPHRGEPAYATSTAGAA